MGKKSLLKSTSKKKNTKTKTDSKKEVTPAGETSEVTASPKKATGSKKQGATKAAPPKSKPAEAKEVKAEAEVKKEKPLSIKELLLKKFDMEKPATLFAVKADDSARKKVEAPPFVSGLDPAGTERVRKLLFKTFDLSTPDPAPVAAEPVVAAVEEKVTEPEVTAAKPEPAASEPVIEKAPAPPSVPVSIEALLKKKFDILVPAALYAPPVAAAGNAIEAPPFVSGLDPAETGRVRKLLFKTFDLSVPDPAPVAAEPVVAAVEEKVPEPEVTAAKPEPAAAEPAIEKAPEPIAAVVEETAPEPEEKAPVAEPEMKAAEPAIEPPKPPQRPLPIGLDFPKPPPVPTMPESIADRPAAETAPCEPKKSICRFFEELDPMIKKAIGAGCVLAAIFFLIGIISFSNMSKYYLVNKDGAVEVWQGRFAPLGKDRIVVLTGAQVEKETKTAFSRAEVVPLIVENFVIRADELMVSPGVPDFEKIRSLLKDALAYARGKEAREGIVKRLNMIEMTALVFKATASAGKESRSDLIDAKDYLTKAALLAKETAEKEIIQQKLIVINDKFIVPATLEKVAPSKPAPPVKQ